MGAGYYDVFSDESGDGSPLLESLGSYYGSEGGYFGEISGVESLG